MWHMHVCVCVCVCVCVYSLLSPHSCPKESKQSGIDKTMDTSGKVKLHIANVPYEMKWQELKDLLRDKGELCCNLNHLNSLELLQYFNGLCPSFVVNKAMRPCYSGHLLRIE